MKEVGRASLLPTALFSTLLLQEVQKMLITELN